MIANNLFKRWSGIIICQAFWGRKTDGFLFGRNTNLHCVMPRPLVLIKKNIFCFSFSSRHKKPNFMLWRLTAAVRLIILKATLWNRFLAGLSDRMIHSHVKNQAWRIYRSEWWTWRRFKNSKKKRKSNNDGVSWAILSPAAFIRINFSIDFTRVVLNNICLQDLNAPSLFAASAFPCFKAAQP